MEDQQAYPQTDNDYRYEEELEQYEYAENAYGNDRDEEQVYEDYIDYPIGDGQEVDDGGAAGAGDGGYIAGDYPSGEDYDYIDYRVQRPYIPSRNVNIKGLTSNKSRYYATYPVHKRSQVLPHKNSALCAHEVGDHRRMNLIEKLNYLKREYDEYPSSGLDPSLSKLKNNKVLRGLSQGDYCTKVPRVQEQIKPQNSRRTAGGAGPSGSYYTQELIPLSHDQLQETFMKNYKLDARKPVQKPSKVYSYDFQVTRNPRVSTTPKSDTAALREYYNAAQKRLLARRLEKHETKDTKSEPNQQNFEPADSVKYAKLSKSKSPGSRSPKGKNTITEENSINCDAIMKATQKPIKLPETDIEVKYRNEDFDTAAQDVDTGVQDVRYPGDTDTSEDKVLTSPFKDSTKMQSSLQSRRSKKSFPSVRARQYSDMVKLQKSKCTVFSVIYDGIQKCEQSKYEYMPTFKYAPTRISNDKPSKESQTMSSSSEISAELMTNMVKEFRDYHYENIFREVKRLQDLDILPKKIKREMDNA